MAEHVSQFVEADAAADDDARAVLSHAFPDMQTFSFVGDAVKQANAEGARACVVTAGGTHDVFLKRMLAGKYADRPWSDLRRALMYARTEARFYNDVAPLLIAKGFDAALMPRCYHAACDLTGLIGDAEGADDVSNPPTLGESAFADPAAQKLSADVAAGKGASFVLSAVAGDVYQASPLPAQEAVRCLQSLALLHGAAWGDAALLSTAADRLCKTGGSYHLRIRNPKELAGMVDAWEAFMSSFGDDPKAAAVFATAGVKDLGRRCQAVAEYVSKELSPSAHDPHATLVHGDFKAMNVFLPNDKRQPAVLIDFAMSGVGYGMLDVAMHIAHAVRPSDIDAFPGGEAGMVAAYLEKVNAGRGAPYPTDTAMRHYRLATVDYLRFMIGRFWKTATPAAFASRAESQNTTLVNRDLDAALAFVVRAEACLAQVEAEMR